MSGTAATKETAPVVWPETPLRLKIERAGAAEKAEENAGNPLFAKAGSPHPLRQNSHMAGGNIKADVGATGESPSPFPFRMLRCSWKDPASSSRAFCGESFLAVNCYHIADIQYQIWIE